MIKYGMVWSLSAWISMIKVLIYAGGSYWYDQVWHSCTIGNYVAWSEEISHETKFNDHQSVKRIIANFIAWSNELS